MHVYVLQEKWKHTSQNYLSRTPNEKNLVCNQKRKPQKNRLNTKTRDLLLFISTWEPQTQSDHFQISPKEIRFFTLTSESVRLRFYRTLEVVWVLAKCWVLDACWTHASKTDLSISRSIVILSVKQVLTIHLFSLLNTMVNIP